jgi:hypothetical protein
MFLEDIIIPTDFCDEPFDQRKFGYVGKLSDSDAMEMIKNFGKYISTSFVKNNKIILMNEFYKQRESLTEKGKILFYIIYKSDKYPFMMFVLIKEDEIIHKIPIIILDENPENYFSIKILKNEQKEYSNCNEFTNLTGYSNFSDILRRFPIKEIAKLKNLEYKIDFIENEFIPLYV